MKAAAFNYFTARACRVPEKTVVVYARALKEAGLMTSGRRGFAPDMKPEDAATIIIAMLSTDSPARAVERVKRFRNLPYRPDISETNFPEGFELTDGDTIHTALTKIFSGTLEHNPLMIGVSPYVEIHENARQAEIKIGGRSKIRFLEKQRSDETRKADHSEFFGIRRARGLSAHDLGTLALPFQLERDLGKPWEEIARGSDEQGNPLDPSHPWNTGVIDD